MTPRTADQALAVHEPLTTKEGWRRFIDWLDWIDPTHWDDEHNHLHHFHFVQFPAVSTRA